MTNEVQFYAIFQIDPGRLILPHFSVFVAATSPQLRQERRKLEIRSSSHKSLQSPKGPQNTSVRFPLTRSATTLEKSHTFQIDTYEGETHCYRTPRCTVCVWVGELQEHIFSACHGSNWLCVQIEHRNKAHIKNWCLLIDPLNWQQAIRSKVNCLRDCCLHTELSARLQPSQTFHHYSALSSIKGRT